MWHVKELDHVVSFSHSQQVYVFTVLYFIVTYVWYYLYYNGVQVGDYDRVLDGRSSRKAQVQLSCQKTV